MRTAASWGLSLSPSHSATPIPPRGPTVLRNETRAKLGSAPSAPWAPALGGVVWAQRRVGFGAAEPRRRKFKVRGRAHTGAGRRETRGVQMLVTQEAWLWQHQRREEKEAGERE